MNLVKDKIFYHLDTKNFFEPGKSYSIGEKHNPFFAFYERFVPVVMTISNKPNDLMHEMMKYIRERIYEDERLKINPALPSRLKCLWVLPEEHLAERLQYWTGQLNSRKLVKLSCSGNVHHADQRFLLTQPFNFPMQRYMSHKYWSGEMMDEINKTANEEILFTGEIKVLEIMPINF